jgi:hypothetical protein
MYSLDTTSHPSYSFPNYTQRATAAPTPTAANKAAKLTVPLALAPPVLAPEDELEEEELPPALMFVRYDPDTPVEFVHKLDGASCASLENVISAHYSLISPIALTPSRIRKLTLYNAAPVLLVVMT